jgi:hypothetical protein
MKPLIEIACVLPAIYTINTLYVLAGGPRKSPTKIAGYSTNISGRLLSLIVPSQYYVNVSTSFDRQSKKVISFLSLKYQLSPSN